MARGKDNSMTTSNVNLSEKFSEFLQGDSDNTQLTGKNQMNAALNLNLRHLTGKKNNQSLFGVD